MKNATDAPKKAKRSQEELALRDRRNADYREAKIAADKELAAAKSAYDAAKRKHETALASAAAIREGKPLEDGKPLAPRLQPDAAHGGGGSDAND